MPKISEHSRLSKVRTGESFLELHKWMEEDHINPNIKPRRHDIVGIPKNLEIVKGKFGDKAVNEFLYHIREDYEKNIAYKIWNILLQTKITLFKRSKRKQTQL